MCPPAPPHLDMDAVTAGRAGQALTHPSVYGSSARTYRALGGHGERDSGQVQREKKMLVKFIHPI